MSIDVKDVSVTHSTSIIKPPTTSGNIQPVTARNDILSPSSTTSQLRELEQALAAQPIIDLVKVNQIKTEITHGDYSIDVKQVAEKILSIEGMINARSPA